MLAWLSANLGTIIVGAALVLIVLFVIFVMIRDRRSGRSSCSQACGSCPMSAGCERRREEFLQKKESETNGKS